MTVTVFGFSVMMLFLAIVVTIIILEGIHKSLQCIDRSLEALATAVIKYRGDRK